MNEKLGAALRLAERRYAVFPLHWIVEGGKCSCGKDTCDESKSRGKHSITPNGFKDAAANEAQIHEWWTKWPDANIGVPTGAGTGIVVLDCDDASAVAEVKNRAKSIDFRQTVPTTKTGRKGTEENPEAGYHFIFEYPKNSEVKSGTPFVKLDVKADGGYIVVPPSYLPHMRSFFGMDRAVGITPDRVRAYQNHRIDEGASNATVNREVATLGRMLSLALNAGKLSRKPKFAMLAENNVRQGFLEHGDFVSLLGNLADHLQPVVEFLYLSGWRKGEALKLEWREVDLSGRVVRLRIENSKNKEARVLPLTGRLWEVIQERTRARRLDCPQVFHHDDHKIGDFRKSWATACKKSGLEGTLVHDLRRCAARNLSRAGVPETVAMEITGHKTRSMYRRYRIVDERDLREATERLQSHLDNQDGAKVIPLRANQ